MERGAGQGGGEVRGADWVCGGSGRVGEEWTVMMREIDERGAGDRFGLVVSGSRCLVIYPKSSDAITCRPAPRKTKDP